MADLAKHLEAAMTLTGKRQVDIVRATGLDRAQVSRIVNGKQPPSAAQLASIAEALGLNDEQRARLLEAAA